MLSSPKPGQRVQCWYRDRSQQHHGKAATVVKPGKKRPRNHLVKLDDGGELVIVPAGNLKATD